MAEPSSTSPGIVSLAEYNLTALPQLVEAMLRPFLSATASENFVRDLIQVAQTQVERDYREMIAATRERNTSILQPTLSVPIESTSFQQSPRGLMGPEETMLSRANSPQGSYASFPHLSISERAAESDSSQEHTEIYEVEIDYCDCGCHLAHGSGENLAEFFGSMYYLSTNFILSRPGVARVPRLFERLCILYTDQEMGCERE